jgi:hypothetical protein
MAYPNKTVDQIRTEKLIAIDNINRILNRGTTEVRDSSGHQVKRDLTALYRRRDELLAEVGGLDGDLSGPNVQTGHIRQVRMIGRKGL